MTTGTSNADFLIGTDNADSIFGLGGNDALFGKGGKDSLYGGDDNDLLAGGAGDDLLHGGNGFDTANFNDHTSGVEVHLGSGEATFRNEQGDIAETDTLVSIEGVTGTAFKDLISGDDNANTLNGKGGNDQLWGGGGGDKLYGEDGDDFIYGGTGGDLINGGSGDDVAQYYNSTKAVKIDLAAGTAAGGEASGDTLVSIEGVTGSSHNDTLSGDDHDNYFSADTGDDTVKGGGGDDYIVGGDGADTLKGGKGVDTINYNASSAGVDIDLAANTAAGGDANGDAISGFEWVSASSHDDEVFGNGMQNFLFGSAGEDMLNGRGGDDEMFGGTGNDTLIGGDGNDIMFGESGRDTHTGGGGEDSFVFSSLTYMGNTAATRDIVTDFEAGTDTLYLGGVDANAALNGDQAFTFIGTQGFSGAAGELHAFAEGGNTIVEGDVNGDKQADFQIQLTGLIGLSDTDFGL